MIKVVLWDLDQTLLDFKRSEFFALKKAFEHFGLGELDFELHKSYSKINEDCWRMLERCELTKPQVMEERFKRFFAKENIVATIGVLLSKGETVNTLLPTAVAGFSFLVFNLLNSPCIAAISAMAKEINSKKWFFFALLYQNVFAYLVCLMIYQIGGLFSGTVSFNFFTPVAFMVLLLFVYQIVKKDRNKIQ